MRSTYRPLALASLVLLLAVASSRLVEHPWNLTPLGAMALFCGATFADRRAALFMPLAALAIGDLFMGWHLLLPVVYASFALRVLIGRRLVRGRVRPGRVLGASLLGSLQFFVATNLGSWLAFYPNTLGGLGECFVAALPYFRNTLAGDLFFSAALFGGWAVLTARVPALRERAEAATA